MLPPVAVDPQHDQDRVVPKHDPVDHQDPEVHVVKRLGKPRRHLLLGQRHESPRDGALRDAPLLRLEERLEAPRVLARRHAARDRLQRVSIQRVPVGGKDEARQRELAGGASCPKPTDLDAASSERHLRTRAARTDRLPLGVLLPLRTAAGVPVVLHQHAQHLLAHADTQVEQGTLPVYERPQNGQRDLDGDALRRLDDLEMSGRTGMLGHGGSFLLVGTTSVTHGGGRSRRSQPFKSSTPTASGTSPSHSFAVVSAKR